MNDLRFALRQLLKNPGFTAVAVLTLALGIGATTAISSVVRTALFDPVPVLNADRLVVLKARDKEQGRTAQGLNPIAARDVEAATNLFQRAAFWEMDSLTLEGGDFPQPLGGARVSHGFFGMFPVPPMLGRLPSIEDAARGAAPVLVLSHAVWQKLFGGDPSVVGRNMRFKESSVTVIGVMPPHFTFPAGYTGYWQAWSGPDAKAGEVVDTANGMGPKSLPNTGVIAELLAGVTMGQARAFLDVVQARQAQTDKLQTQFTFIAENLRDSFAKPELRRTLWALTAATVLVLLIAAANLANLQLARTETRQQELAVRSALGAGRARMFRQLLGESLLLAALGGGAGLLVTLFGLELLTKLLPAELPRLKAIELDGSVLTLASLVTLATGVLFGVAPAWRGGAFDVSATLKLGSATATGGTRRASFTRGLIVGQIALVLVLLFGAGLMVRSVSKLLAVDVGFDARRVVKLYPPLDFGVINRFLGSAKGTEDAEAYVNGVYGDLQRRLAALPSVEAVGIAQPGNSPVKVSSVAGGATAEFAEYRVGIEEADPLQAMRARLKQGRWLVRGDDVSGREQVLLNESAAGRLWPDGSPIGKRLWLKAGDQEAVVMVAGVIADLRENAYDEDPAPTVFRATTMSLFGPGRALVMRTGVHYSALRPAIERELKAVGAGSSQPNLQFMEEALFIGTAGHRTFKRYLLFFAGVGLLLAAIGLYGVLAYSVSRRTREIGIRVAVGAQHGDITGLVLHQGLRLMAAGVGIGVVVSLAVTRSLKAFLFGVPAHDPVTLLSVVTVMAAVALLACWLPARRAARVDPMVALRSE
ncbi:MAG: ABC transporter permease [Limisphaerales bacterium]